MKKVLTALILLCTWGWKALSTGATVAINLIFLVSLVILISLLFFHPETKVPDGAALLLAPEGNIVEQRSAMDPMARMVNKLVGGPVHEETPLQDILDAIHAASTDDRIKMLVVSPSRLERVGFNQLRDIGQAIERFKDNGKIVISADNAYSQGQYYLAAYADEVYLNPMGKVDLHGFGVFRLYFRELLNKLDVQFHVFRVGTFKSALEPFLRDNMSPAAKEANQQWLTRLWTTFCQDISKQRGLTVEVINNLIDNLDVSLEKANGDAALMALNSGLIDGLKTRRQLEDYLSSIVGRGEDGTGFKHISLYNYLQTITPSYSNQGTENPAVGIVVAAGDIVSGEGSVGQVGADVLLQQIKKARQDRKIKAVVLRIDSGGGSAFASELIRQELLLTRETGKPVVISMGALAASGAYWLAADADAILASPVTLTGSIGIFGALPTFEKSLARAGVYNDGIGTTSIAGGLSPTRKLTPTLSRILQLSVEQGYRQFISIVSEGRKMPLSRVEEIAEGRVWDGKTALEIGLVDETGSLQDAVTKAAELAGLEEERGIYIDTPAPFLSRLQQLGTVTIKTLLNNQTISPALQELLEQTMRPLSFLYQQSDPANLYTHSLLFPSTIDF